MSDTEKYVIYQNDLKFRKSRNLNSNKIDWEQNNIKHLYQIDHDTLEYRIKESDKNNNVDIDLRELELDKIPIELSNKKFINLTHLFLSNNNISDFVNLDIFNNLLTVDLDSNNIDSIKLPNSLIELSINNNKLTSINLNKNLVRFKASNNKLNNIVLSDNIEIAELDNNNITNLDIKDSNKLNRLIIFSNPLEKIDIINLKYLDISETNIKELKLTDSIENVVANSCKYLTNITKSKSLKTLEIINTPVDKLYFYDSFELIVLQLNLTKNISKKYRDVNANINIRKNTLLVISRGCEILDDNSKIV
jgi:hypothetical protein